MCPLWACRDYVTFVHTIMWSSLSSCTMHAPDVLHTTLFVHLCTHLDTFAHPCTPLCTSAHLCSAAENAEHQWWQRLLRDQEGRGHPGDTQPFSSFQCVRIFVQEDMHVTYSVHENMLFIVTPPLLLPSLNTTHNTGHMHRRLGMVYQ